MALVEPSYPRNDTSSPLHTSLSNGGSRLLEMKARFQQRQLAEKEQKLLQLYQNQQERTFARVGGSPNGIGQTSLDSSSILGASLGGGKVRQLFDGRRGAAAGRDRSHPLEPLQTDGSTQSNARGFAQIQGRSAPLPSNRRSQSLVRPAPVKQATRTVNKSPIHSLSGSQDEQFNSKTSSDNSIHSQVFGKLVNVGNMQRSKPANISRTSNLATSSATKTRNSGMTITTNRTSGSITARLAQTSISPKKSPEIKEAPIPSRGAVRKTPAATASLNSTTITPTNSTKTPSRANSNTSRGSSAKSFVDSPREPPASTFGNKSPSTGSSSNTNSDLKECKNCGRRFNSDRITAHEKICTKTAQKRRKIFDPVKQRVKGTEAEQYVLHRPTRTSTPPKAVKKADWRKKHEEFISTIRAAKQVKEHLAKGGKLSDLPPPPPLDTSDYTQCPHCGRKFNDAAAERHVPLCARMQHNKPKPNNTKRR